MIFANSPVGNFFYRKTLYEMAVEISIEERAQSQHFRCNFYTSGPTPHITSQPTVQLFLQVHSARCNWFCGAADAGLEQRRRGAECRAFFGVAGFAPTPNFELATSQPAAQIFGRLHSASCNWFCGGADAELEAWQALHLSLTFSKLLVHQPHLAPRSPPCSFFCDAICLILRSCGCGVRSCVAECNAA